MNRELVIGRIRTTFGLAGEVKVESYSGETDHFTRLSEVDLVDGDRRIRLRIESVRVNGRELLVKFAGIGSPEEASKLRNWSIVVDRRDACPAGPDEYYFADLIGLEVYVGDAPVGSVVAILEGGPRPLLQIELPAGGRRLVPFQDPFVAEVDLDRSRLVLSTGEVLA